MAPEGRRIEAAGPFTMETMPVLSSRSMEQPSRLASIDCRERERAPTKGALGRYRRDSFT